MKKLFQFTLMFALLAVFCGSAMGAITVSTEVESVFGNKRIVMATLAFDSSYPTDGETLHPRTLGMKSIELAIINPKDGYSFYYDVDNRKVKVFREAPPVVYEEQHTVPSGTSKITLEYPAAYIMAVASANDNIPITDADATLGTDEVQPDVDFASGVSSVLQFGTATTPGVTVYVTYITQAWEEVFINLVQSEDVTVSGNSGYMANLACAIQSVRLDGTVDTNTALMMDKDDNNIGRKQCGIDWSATGQVSQVKTAAGDAVTHAYVSYIKKPSGGFLYDNFVEEETPALVMDPESGNTTYVHDYPILLWSYAGQVPISGESTHTIINESGTRGVFEAVITFKNRINSGVSNPEGAILGESGATGATTSTYIKGRPWEVSSKPLEVINGTDLSNLSTVEMMIIGR